MQKGDINKLKMLLMGLQTRLEKNKEYFVAVKMLFTSGKKQFGAEIVLAEGDWNLSYQGAVRSVSAQEITDFFVEQAPLYDEAKFTYTERGHQMIISCTKRGVQFKQHEQKEAAQNTQAANNPLLEGGREYIIRVDKAAPLLKEIGILTAEGKIKNDMIRKYNQIDHYVELVAPMFEKDSEEEIVLLDCACGKSYLSFVMNYYLRDVLGKRCRIIGIDINEHVVKESREMAQRLGYHNMQFEQADLNFYTPPAKVTAVISLHACDIATDLALGTAVRAGAKYIACVPCCHKELLDQYALPELAPLTRHGVFHARFNDVLTDSLRVLRLEAAGYKTSVVEYISPLDTPKNLLIRGVLTGKENRKAMQEYEAVRRVLGTHSTLDRLLTQTDDAFFITDNDLH